MVTKIVKLLPETPYTALGLNTVWNVLMDEGEDTTKFTRRHFAIPGRPLYEHFKEENAKFGAYFSKAFGPFRLRTGIKPVKLSPPGVDAIQLSANFNIEFNADEKDKVSLILDGVDRWTAAFQEAKDILDLLVAES